MASQLPWMVHYQPSITLTKSGFLVWLAAVPAPLSHGPVPCHVDGKHRRLGQIKTPEPICRALRSFLLCPILDSLLLLQTVVFPQADGGQFGSLLGQLLQVTWLQPAVDFEGLFWRSSGHFWRNDHPPPFGQLPCRMDRNFQELFKAPSFVQNARKTTELRPKTRSKRANGAQKRAPSSHGGCTIRLLL